MSFELPHLERSADFWGPPEAHGDAPLIDKFDRNWCSFTNYIDRVQATNKTVATDNARASALTQEHQAARSRGRGGRGGRGGFVVGRGRGIGQDRGGRGRGRGKNKNYRRTDDITYLDSSLTMSATATSIAAFDTEQLNRKAGNDFAIPPSTDLAICGLPRIYDDTIEASSFSRPIVLDEPLAVPFVGNHNTLDGLLSNKAACFLFFLPDDDDNRTRLIEIMNEAAGKVRAPNVSYGWLIGGKQLALEKTLEVGDKFPTVVALQCNPLSDVTRKIARVAYHAGTFTVDPLVGRMKKILESCIGFSMEAQNVRLPPQLFSIEKQESVTPDLEANHLSVVFVIPSLEHLSNKELKKYNEKEKDRDEVLKVAADEAEAKMNSVAKCDACAQLVDAQANRVMCTMEAALVQRDFPRFQDLVVKETITLIAQIAPTLKAAGAFDDVKYNPIEVDQEKELVLEATRLLKAAFGRADPKPFKTFVGGVVKGQHEDNRVKELHAAVVAAEEVLKKAHQEFTARQKEISTRQVGAATRADAAVKDFTKNAAALRNQCTATMRSVAKELQADENKRNDKSKGDDAASQRARPLWFGFADGSKSSEDFLRIFGLPEMNSENPGRPTLVAFRRDPKPDAPKNLSFYVLKEAFNDETITTCLRRFLNPPVALSQAKVLPIIGTSTLEAVSDEDEFKLFPFSKSTSQNDTQLLAVLRTIEAGPFPVVITTDECLATMMASCRSVHSWHLHFERFKRFVFIEKMEKSHIEIEYVAENNTMDGPSENAANPYDRISTLGDESTRVSAYFRKQCLTKNPVPNMQTEKNPFPGTTSMYKYRRYVMHANQPNQYYILVRSEVDAMQKVRKAGPNGPIDTFRQIRSFGLLEHITKERLWNGSIDATRSRVLVHEARQNDYKFSRWLALCVLSSAEAIKIGFISRAREERLVSNKDEDGKTNSEMKVVFSPERHEIVAVETMEPIVLASQLGLNIAQMWSTANQYIERYIRFTDEKISRGDDDLDAYLMKHPNEKRVELFQQEKEEGEEEEEEEDEEEEGGDEEDE